MGRFALASETETPWRCERSEQQRAEPQTAFTAKSRRAVSRLQGRCPTNFGLVPGWPRGSPRDQPAPLRQALSAPPCGAPDLVRARGREMKMGKEQSVVIAYEPSCGTHARRPSVPRSKSAVGLVRTAHAQSRTERQTDDHSNGSNAQNRRAICRSQRSV
jgi:hypothetical protein